MKLYTFAPVDPLAATPLQAEISITAVAVAAGIDTDAARKISAMWRGYAEVAYRRVEAARRRLLVLQKAVDSPCQN